MTRGPVIGLTLAAVLTAAQHARPRALVSLAPAGRDQIVTRLRDAAYHGPVADALPRGRPAIEEYDLLRTALARYRVLVDTVEAWTPPTNTLHPGDRFDGDVGLRTRLIALGDLPPAAGAVSTGVYDATLVDGIKRFQRRHGLDVDGVIGAETRHELSLPLAQRVRQIELALERLRRLPPSSDAPLLVLNIPMFELTGWDHGWTGAPAFTMKAIVGRPATPTPELRTTIESVIFRPYWNVPLSIVRRELLPALRKDATFLERERMEVVRGYGDDADVVDAGADTLDLLARGALRLRQRPGPKNALGLIKFMVPNEESVYLHGTPNQGLFLRSRRAFSHGCVRVEDPVALAEWVLKGSAGWSRDRIVETIANPAVVSRTIRLPRQIPVIFVYMTAGAMPDGSVRFARDIYGQDVALERVLQRQQ